MIRCLSGLFDLAMLLGDRSCYLATLGTSNFLVDRSVLVKCPKVDIFAQ